MNRTSSPASVGEPGPGDARETLSLRPIVFMVLALLAVGALVGLSVLDARPPDDVPEFAADPHPGWFWLGGLVAGGLVVAAGALWWRAKRRAGHPAARAAELAQVRAGLRPMVEARAAQLAGHRQIHGWVYWEQDADGVYRVVEPGSDPALARVRQLLGSTRETGIRVDDPAQWHRTARLIERRQSFGELYSRRALADGSEIEVEECGGPRYDVDGRFLGYAGLIRERRDGSGTVSQFDLGALAAILFPVAILETRTGARRHPLPGRHARGPHARRALRMGQSGDLDANGPESARARFDRSRLLDRPRQGGRGPRPPQPCAGARFRTGQSPGRGEPQPVRR